MLATLAIITQPLQLISGVKRLSRMEVIAVTYTDSGMFFLDALFVIWILGAVINRRQLQRLADGRDSEDIGTFARSFDQRREPFDPHVARVQPSATAAASPRMSLVHEPVCLRPMPICRFAVLA